MNSVNSFMADIPDSVIQVLAEKLDHYGPGWEEEDEFTGIWGIPWLALSTERPDNLRAIAAAVIEEHERSKASCQ